VFIDGPNHHIMFKGNINLNQFLIHIHQFPPTLALFPALQLSSQKELFLGTKNIVEAFVSGLFPPPRCAYDSTTPHIYLAIAWTVHLLKTAVPQKHSLTTTTRITPPMLHKP
jgi:hypothetical protein